MIRSSLKLLFPRLNKPNSFKLSSEVKFSDPLLILVALCFTLSNFSMFLLNWEDQNWTQYSLGGLKSAKQSGITI